VFFHLEGDEEPLFHYMFDNAFGTVSAPHAGECHATVLQLLQIEEINTLTNLDIRAHRRVDDTLFLNPLTATTQQRADVLTGFYNVCKRAQQPISDDKTVFDQHAFTFDGYHHILNYFGPLVSGQPHPGAVGIGPERRGKMTLQVRHIISGKATRKEAESLCGLVEWGALAIPIMKALIVEFRKRWVPLPFDTSICKPGDTASYLDLLLTMLSTPLYTPYQHLFVLTEPTLHYTTDASGNDAIGGYAGLPSKFGCTGADWFFTQPLHSFHVLTNESTKTNEFNTTFLELLGLYYVLHTAHTTPHNHSVVWWTDSLSGTICWEKQSSTHIPTNRILIQIALYCAKHHILVQARHIHREHNTTADMLTHALIDDFCKTQGATKESQRSVPNRAINKSKSIRFRSLAHSSPLKASTNTTPMDSPRL
jgi:hypothetical protein